MTKECPLCGETMHLRVNECLERLPATGETKRVTVREWICAECDFFEEAEENDVSGPLK